MSNGHYYKELEPNLSLDEVLDYLKASYGNIQVLESTQEEYSEDNRFTIIGLEPDNGIIETRNNGASVTYNGFINFNELYANITQREVPEYLKDRDGLKFISNELGKYRPENPKYLHEYYSEKFVKERLARLPPEIDLPFFGGFIGGISYDRTRHIKNAPPLKTKSVLGTPLLFFTFYNGALIFDKKVNKFFATSIISTRSAEAFGKRIIKEIEKLQKKEAKLKAKEENKAQKQAKVNANANSQKVIKGKTLLEETCNNKALSNNEKDNVDKAKVTIKSSVTKKRYLSDLECVHEDIREGQVYQINYTQRFSSTFTGDDWELYKVLKKRNGAPYACFLGNNDYRIISSSPELFLKVKDGIISTKPIKGTIRRGETKEEDEKLKLELLNSEKDKSELLMITDLERNDLGKICKAGTVKVPKLFEIETYPTLHHLVCEVSGELEEGIDIKDIIEATFPGGSITGAPKLAAMQEIDKLEEVPREMYTGTVGFIDIFGNCEFNILIRTFIRKGNKIAFSAGGGIVWDSNNEAEYEESQLKAMALKESLKCLS